MSLRGETKTNKLWEREPTNPIPSSVEASLPQCYCNTISKRWKLEPKLSADVTSEHGRQRPPSLSKSNRREVRKRTTLRFLYFLGLRCVLGLGFLFLALAGYSNLN